MVPADLAQAVRSVSEAPEDDAPRLVFADWLQDRQHPWGELITIQCGLGRALGPTPERARLLRREHELLSNRAWWPFDGIGFRVDRFSRGFPAQISADNVAGLRTLGSRMPWLPEVDDIRIMLAENDMLALAGLPPLPTRGLTFQAGDNYELDLLDVRLLLRWLGTRPLSRLGMHGRARTVALERLFGAPDFIAGLRDLELVNTYRPYDLSPFDGAALRRLSITGVALVRPAQRAQLESLEIARANVGAAVGFVAAMPRLRELHLTETSLVDDNARTIVERASKLEVLGLAKNNLGARTVTVLAEATKLHALELWGNPIGDEGAEHLAGSTVSSLDLVATGLTAEGARMLVRSTTLPPTLKLSVSGGEVGAALAELRERFAVVIAR